MGSSKHRKNPYLLFSTTDSLKEAEKIARFLISKKLAACVNVLPHLKSYFRWQGKVDQAKEFLLIIKTDRKQLRQVEIAIRKLHSYTTPEMIGWPIQWGSKSYLDWLTQSTS